MFDAIETVVALVSALTLFAMFGGFVSVTFLDKCADRWDWFAALIVLTALGASTRWAFLCLGYWA